MSNDLQNTSNASTNQFTAGMKKDLNSSLVSPDSWIHARNAVNNAHTGELGVLGNEPANFRCVTLPYTYVGSIHITGDRWVVFTTNDLESEIGLFDESDCSYKKIVNDRKLGFKTTQIISGSSKKNFDCTYSIYWDDGINPSRVLNIDRPVYKLKDKKQATCNVPEYTTDLDVEKLRLARTMQIPTLELSKGVSGGSMPNGSYQVAIAYTSNQIRVTEYIIPSNVQSLFSHQNMQGSLKVDITNLDTSFEQYELVLISYINETTDCRKIGVYSTHQSVVAIDNMSSSLTTVPMEYIPLMTPAYDKSDAMYEVSNYLLRVGIYTKTDFNYQPIANKIQLKWVAVEMDMDYYRKSGNAVGYMRDERYPFFIRWIYNTGQKSASYHIPGREPKGSDRNRVSGPDVFELKDGDKKIPEKWSIENTATVTSTTAYDIAEGRVIAEGEMGFWESTEKYPDNSTEVWGDLCGRNIRHPLFPDNHLVPLHNVDGTKIYILGVKLDNIQHPVDFDGNPIENIVGYEILRGSRNGNKSVIAKGLLNNVGEYDIPGAITTRKGLYPNYPYNDLRTDPFLSKNRVKGGCQGKEYEPMGSFRKDTFTFHSPETQFRNPFLSPYELKIESEEWGTVTGNYEAVYKHPRHKMIRDFALIVGGLVGVGTGLMSIMGKKTTTTQGPTAINLGLAGVGSTSIPAGGPVVAGYYTGTGFIDGLLSSIGGSALTGALDGLTSTSKLASASALATTPGVIGGSKSTTTESSILSGLPLPLKIIGGTFLFTYFFSKGTEEALRIIRALLPYEQFAYQYNSHGFYNHSLKVRDNNRRRKILDANYLEPHLQEFGADTRVNNLFRSRSVILKLDSELEAPQTVDTTRQTIGDLNMWDNPTDKFTTTTSAYYGALKHKLDNQYGQVDSIIQIPVPKSIHLTEPDKIRKVSSGVLFGGDTYVNTYTEKNTFFFFNDWMFEQPDGYEFDYNLSNNIPYARYWLNTQEYDISQLTGALARLNFSGNVLPNDLAHLDRKQSDCMAKVSFGINKAYFYLFANGVREFFVESEINTAMRDHDDSAATRHYDAKEYTDLSALFRSDIIKTGNNFKYDYSLSASRLLHNFISWGQVLPRDYNPADSAKCYSYYPNRVIYSLPADEELKKDNWLSFLANNYKDFATKITAIKPVAKTGALILFESDAPVMFQGVDQLQTEGGIKITIGDGGLFNQQLQSVSNADKQYEYGACQSRESVIATPQGVFLISQNQGKIFAFGEGLKEISEDGNLFWFSQYLPSRLLLDFPTFAYPDNMVKGVGSISGYDNTNRILYFTKKDYQLKDQYKGKVTYVKEDQFLYAGAVPVKLGDPQYFDNASFTISYDPKVKGFISFHDWIPQAMLPSRNHLLTIKDGAIWKHNSRWDLFCNFYDEDFPFEVEYAVSTGQDVTTLRSIEYVLEAYRYSKDGRSQFHLLDENFDRAVIHNSEQCSGDLKLVLKPKNNPWMANNFPVYNSNHVEILFAKEENKYRINQVADLVRDRGEFTDNENFIWNVAANGYVKDLNPFALDYRKNALQRKKIRHYTTKVIFKKFVSGGTKLLFKLSNNKQQKSFR